MLTYNELENAINTREQGLNDAFSAAWPVMHEHDQLVRASYAELLSCLKELFIAHQSREQLPQERVRYYQEFLKGEPNEESKGATEIIGEGSDTSEGGASCSDE